MQRDTKLVCKFHLPKKGSNHTAQEAPGGQKQTAAVAVILANHQRKELWKRKPK